MDSNGWDKRIRRAGELSERASSAHEVLSFYRHILEAQRGIYQDISARPAAAVSLDISLRERLDTDYAMRWMPAVLDVVRRHGPAKLAAEADRIAVADSRHQRQLLADYVNKAETGDDSGRFLARVIWQPIAEFLAAQYKVSTNGSESKCPICGGWPQLAVLRPEGDGGKRHLQCSFCLTNGSFAEFFVRPVRKSTTPNFRDTRRKSQKRFASEACDTCKFYLKSFDMTADGLLVPEVDEIATIALDLWANEHGYRKIHQNVTGF